MNPTHNSLRTLFGAVLVAASAAACAAGAGASTAVGGTAAPLATGAGTTTPAGSAGAVATQAGGTAGAYCSLFTADALKAFLGTDLGSGTTRPAQPNSCSWTAADGTTLAIEKAPDEIVCEGLKAAATGGGLTSDGDYWAGREGAGDAFVAGVTIGGDTCYDVKITPVAKAPAPAAVIAFVKQFVQAAGG